MKKHLAFLSSGLLILAAVGELRAEYPVAGLKPDQRPEGAPIVSETGKGDVWRQRALTGVSAPYPPSLRFLEDQGNWYTPFDRPGMTGPYDLRGWHR